MNIILVLLWYLPQFLLLLSIQPTNQFQSCNSNYLDWAVGLSLSDWKANCQSRLVSECLYFSNDRVLNPGRRLIWVAWQPHNEVAGALKLRFCIQLIFLVLARIWGNYVKHPNITYTIHLIALYLTAAQLL